ncbi:MAG TPA: hypothetical protein VMH23_13985 [Bacteroidota bacterium]|nr:hypothetical protein [Bacteroidota bacterium]
MTPKASNSLKDVWDFIRDNFNSMPAPVRVLVYLLFVAYFLLTSVRQLWPDVWNLIWDSEQEVAGEIRAADGSYLSAASWLTEINGERLYVKKMKVADDRFYYQWILKFTPKQLHTNVHFDVAEFYQDPQNAQIKGSRFLFGVALTPAGLKAREKSDGEVVLALDLDRRSLNYVAPITHPDTTSATNVGSLSWLIPSAYAQSKSPMKTLSKDSASFLLRTFRQQTDPVSDRETRYLLPAGGSAITIAAAESLVVAARHGNKGAMADYAGVLTEYDSLFLFTSAGSASKVFTNQFYAAFVPVIRTGNEYESRRVAWFLYKLQDARSLPYIFAEYSNARDTRAKKLCLYALEAFAWNGDANVLLRVKNWLLETQQREQSREMVAAIQQCLGKFDNAGRKHY